MSMMNGIAVGKHPLEKAHPIHLKTSFLVVSPNTVIYQYRKRIITKCCSQTYILSVHGCKKAAIVILFLSTIYINILHI